MGKFIRILWLCWNLNQSSKFSFWREARSIFGVLSALLYNCILGGKAEGRKRKSQQETKNVLYVRIKEKSQNLLQIGILRNCRRQPRKRGKMRAKRKYRKQTWKCGKQDCSFLFYFICCWWSGGFSAIITTHTHTHSYSIYICLSAFASCILRPLSQ